MALYLFPDGKGTIIVNQNSQSVSWLPNNPIYVFQCNQNNMKVLSHWFTDSFCRNYLTLVKGAVASEPIPGIHPERDPEMLIHSYGHFSIPNPPCEHFFPKIKTTQTSGEHSMSLTWLEYIQTVTQSSGSNQGSLNYSAAPPCHPEGSSNHNKWQLVIFQMSN